MATTEHVSKYASLLNKTDLQKGVSISSLLLFFYLFILFLQNMQGPASVTHLCIFSTNAPQSDIEL